MYAAALTGGRQRRRDGADDRGRCLLDGALPLEDRILIVSARAGFEIVQKALMAQVPVLGSVGAASSLAVNLAKDRMALYSFLGNGRGHRYV